MNTHALTQALTTLVAQRDLLVQQLGRRTDEVAAAKYRQSLQPRVLAAMTELQRRVHERSVGVYEQLLTALVEEVLPDPDDTVSIVFDLHTERGLPALDIEASRNGKRESILDGCGGSLTNVVSAAMRFVALSRTPLRKFLVLDEADCWLAPARVPAFMNVVNQMATEIGVQSLCITHHDPFLFEESAFILRLEPATTRHPLRVVPVGGVLPQWDADQPGVRRIHLTNFMSHTDTWLELSPAANALTGPNHKGKSAVVTALRAVAEGAGADSMIQHDKPQATVELHIEAGQVLRWERMRKGKVRERYTLLDAGGQVLHMAETARGVPDWASAALGIARVDGLDIQIGRQTQPVFLLDAAPSKRAAILSLGQESDYLQKMSARYKAWQTEDQVTIRTGEREITRLQKQLEALSGLPELEARLTLIEQQVQSQQQLSVRIARLDTLHARMVQVAGVASTRYVAPKAEGLPTLQDTRALQRVIARLPRLQQLSQAVVPASKVVPAMQDTKPLLQMGRQLTRVRNLLSKAPTAITMPEPVALKPTRDLIQQGQRLKALQNQLQQAQAAMAAARDALADAQKTCADLEAALPSTCPTCQQAWPHQHEDDAA